MTAQIQCPFSQIIGFILRHLNTAHLCYLYFHRPKGIGLKLNAELKVEQFVWRGMPHFILLLQILL